MGYSGGIYVAKAERPAALSELTVLWEKSFPGGWYELQLDGFPESGALREVVTATGAPALVAVVLDSDMAHVQALSPAGVAWAAYLHADNAEAFGAPELPHSPDEIVDLAVAWSAEAGLDADPETVRAALNAENTFAEETFAGLLAALGISED
ncbi:hypothetical protein Aph02nite_09310 [Actinoplanes philippinensis]|uniref:Uncharacterized protein n=1 Tax=Actinoplanes philippinensis TaxID=35752 RepID=A0A1I2AAV0_9ACTN|nr:hypothetical protein [Actinoplanes philippinensis]GIE74981.1 hypothetical protein Aph02nite_09310 [Actinoplanes philippinensis]SFE41091.1 hypothetical protein SAMN05421541_101611 [Actinoplanes philippinensis]